MKTAAEKGSHSGQRAQHDQRAALARGLLLEAVDAMRQASELLDDDAAAALRSQADELTRFVGRLPGES